MSRHDEYMILIADDDRTLCSLISEFLLSKGYKTVIAYDGHQALELLNTLNPHLVIIDVCMPLMGGLQFLEETRISGSVVPVIVVTGHPDVETAIKSIQNGAFDYIVKPLQLEVLDQKIGQALKTTKLTRENAVLSELASLHEITNKLTNTHNLSELLDVTLKCCLDLTTADSGSILLVDKVTNDLVIALQKGLQSPSVRSPMSNENDWVVSKWVIKNGRSLLIAGDTVSNGLILNLDRKDISSSITVPLKVVEDIIGVVTLNRKLPKEPFSVMHQNIIEVLAAQAGIAINNASLYESVNQKLSELSLISKYSEQLMGLVDRDEVIGCLFDTVRKHFPIDMVSYLGPQKRSVEFVYWSRKMISDKILTRIRDELIDEYNADAPVKLFKKRSTVRVLAAPDVVSEELCLPFGFRYRIKLALDEADTGMLFFGSTKALDSSDEKVALLSSLINQTRIALTNSKLYSDMKENYIKTIKALAIAVDAKDTYTHGHSENVMNIAEEIAREMALDARIIGIVRDGALLHDIGKIGIPGYILNKPGALTYDEFNGIMKTHAALGANIVKDVPFLKELYSPILCHHENFDGSGYPNGLKGDLIPLGARILHVADAFEAMTSNRPYRTSLGQTEAFRRLKQERSKQFDPDVIDAFFRVAQRKGWLDESV